ncbi:MAG: recombination-associated protein RdgC [Methylococcaceae bacterium]
MWFKNLAIYRFTEQMNLSATELATKLTPASFRPCGTMELASYGWTSPLGRQSDQLVHASNGYFMICAKKEEKILPPAVVNELAGEKIVEEEQKQGRKLRKKERDSIKDEIIHDLLPKAFSFSRRTYAYIDPKGGWFIVDSPTPKKAEELLSYLRKTLGSLPLVPFSTQQSSESIMTQWLKSHQLPNDFTLEDECDLRSQQDEGSIIRCKRHDLTSPEITRHLDAGKQVIKLAVTWADRLSFVLDENRHIKRLKFLDLVQEAREDIESDDAVGQFDADFSIMTLEINGLLSRLVEILGGLPENQ